MTDAKDPLAMGLARVLNYFGWSPPGYGDMELAAKFIERLGDEHIVLARSGCIMLRGQFQLSDGARLPARTDPKDPLDDRLYIHWQRSIDAARW